MVRVDMKYMRVSAHRIVGQAAIQGFWLNRCGTNEESAIIKDDTSTTALKHWAKDGSITKDDTVYIMELSRLGTNWEDLKGNLTMFREIGAEVIPLRYSLEAKDYGKNFMTAEPEEQTKLLREAQEVYREEAEPKGLWSGNMIELDSPEEESLLLAVLKGQVSRKVAMGYLDVGYTVLQNELHRKASELYAKDDLIIPWTAEVAQDVLLQAVERRLIRESRERKRKQSR